MELADFSPLRPSSRIHILCSALCTFPMVLKRRICVTIRTSLNWWSSSLFSWPLHLIQGWYCKEKLEASQFSVLRSWATHFTLTVSDDPSKCQRGLTIDYYPIQGGVATPRCFIVQKPEWAPVRWATQFIFWLKLPRPVISNLAMVLSFSRL